MMLIGVSGVARVGKDSLYKFAKEYFENKGLSCERFAFADELKRELAPFVREYYDLDVFSDITEEKNVFRDILVAHGRIQRLRTNGAYWVDKVFKSIEKSGADVKFINDCRYLNECEKIHSVGGKVIHLTRYENQWVDYKVSFEPANDEERINDPKVKAAADYRFEWYSFGKNEEEAKKMVWRFLENELK